MAQTRYWVSDVNANWNSDNWANSSNGAPDGGGPPTAAQNARFDVNGSGNCTLNIALDTVTNLELTNYPATIEFDGNSLRATGTVTLTSGALDDNSGGSVLTVVSTGVNTTFNGTDIGVRLDITSDGIELDGSIFREYCDFEKTGNSNSYGAGGNYFYDTLLLEHSGSGGYILSGSNNPDTFSDFVSVTSSGSGYCYLAYSADGTYFQDSIEINSTGTSLGIRFGAAGGTPTVSAGNTIFIGSGGFTSGELELREFNLLDNEAVSLTTTASSFTDLFDCSFGRVVTITSPRITTRGTTYAGLTSLTKTGANNDGSAGGNRFLSNTTIENSGSGYLLFGNGSPDTFDLDLTWTNAGTHYSYLGYNSADNYIGGDLSITNSASGAGATYFYVSQVNGTSTTIDGNVDVLNNGSSDNCRVLFGDQGNVTVGGDAYFENSATGVTSYIQIADNTNSTVSFGGVVEIVNDGSMTTSNVYLGNNGDITIADSLYITNSSDADNSLVYCNHTTNSSAAYSGDIVIENTNASSDGIYFGQAGGTSTQSAGQSFQIDNGGFTDGTLYLRNFIQQGASNVDLKLTNDAQLIIYDSDFGGDFIADAPNINTRGTSYGGDLTLRKTGSVNDNQAGGNSVAGVTTLTNIGSGYWLWGNGSPDSFNSDLVVYDSSSFNFYLAYNSADNYINGDFTMYKANTGTSTYICDIDGTSLSITGDVLVEMTSTSVTSRFYFPDNGALTLAGDYTINNNSDASSSGYAYISTNTNSSATIGGDVTITMGDDGVNNATYIGTNGDVTISGRVDIDNNSATDQSQVIIANASTSDVTIGGVCNTENDGSGTTRRLYLGNYGNVDFGDSLIILNSSDATNSQVYLNYGPTSTNTYAGDILVECTSTDNDGILFGNQTGVGTLADGQTISVTSNGFNGDYLYFRNFTQVGATVQTLSVDGDDGYIYNYSSNWGGNIDFTAPRMYTYDTRYIGDAILEKTGDGSDASPGINYFGGNTELINDGTGYFLMGNGSPDSFMLDLTLINTGTNSMYIGYNQGDNYVGGDLSVEQSADGIIFEAIETAVGAGNSIRKIQYETMDADPLKAVSYYRLKQTDYDGSYSYSQVEQVDYSSESNTTIFASNEDIRINASSEHSERIEITIRDASGRIVHSETWMKSIGKDSYAISQSVIDAAGVYLVTLQGDFTNTTERLFLR